MTIKKDDLQAALDLMDKKDDNLWTDADTPRVSVVRGLLKDDSVTRAIIDELAPGFSRKPPAPPQTPPTSEVHAADVAPIDEQKPDANLVEASDQVPPEGMSEEEARAIMDRRINDCQSAVEQAQIKVRDANNSVKVANDRLNKARALKDRRFPPLDAADAIKAHLKAHQARLQDKVEQEGRYGTNQLDQAMQRRNSRGWSRPSRPVNNAN